ncbi:MAG: starch-binding protein, partial [Muribaculaceae bacterium]|nr:starch-binding protein [Muribaculaceae bacterium]
MKKLLLTLAAGLFMTASASAATVYFDNSATNWSPVNAYVWEPNNGWPGEPTTNVTIDGHALCAFEITGGQTKIIFNNGAGKQTADLKATDGAVYDASGTTPIAQIVDGKYVTGGDLPPVEPTVAVLYLRGDMNSWGATDEWKFTTTDNDTYVLANVDVKKTQSWKIADAGWDDYNFGGATNIALNTAVTMVAGSNTNCNLAADGTNLTFTFVLSTSTLTVTGEGGGGDDPVPPTPVDPTDTDLYLRGSMNGWDAVDAWKFTTTDNDTYVLANVAVSAAATWKIAGAAWG